jgi:catalase
MSDLGTPYGFRHMNGFSGNTFRLVKSETEWWYAKFIVKTDQGIKNNTLAESITQAGTDPDFGITDLYSSSKSYPAHVRYDYLLQFSQKWRFPELDSLLPGHDSKGSRDLQV